MDGTILDTIADLAQAVNYGLDKYNLPRCTVEECKGYVGNGRRNLIMRAVAPVTEQDIIDGVEDAFNKYYNAHSQDLTKPYDGIIEVLHKLKSAGVKLAVLSNKPDEFVGVLGELYFPGVFDVCYGQRDGVPIKPDPTGLHGIINMLGESREDVVFIGDTSVDVKTGLNAGTGCIGVSWGFRTRDSLKEAGAPVIIDNVPELYNAIVDK